MDYALFEVQSVGYLSNPLYDRVRSDVPLAELPYLPKSRNSFGWRDSEKYMIAYLELKWPTPLVGIAFLVDLRGFHSFLDYPNFVRGSLDQFWPDSKSLAILLPT